MSAWSSEVPTEPGWWWLKLVDGQTGEELDLDCYPIYEGGWMRGDITAKEFVAHLTKRGEKALWQRAVPPRED